MKGKIEIETNGSEVWIINKAEVQMYGGDPGTTVYAAVVMDADELYSYIAELTAVHKKILREKLRRVKS